LPQGPPTAIRGIFSLGRHARALSASFAIILQVLIPFLALRFFNQPPFNFNCFSSAQTRIDFKRVWSLSALREYSFFCCFFYFSFDGNIIVILIVVIK
jgi:hypothetical protein